MNRDHFTLTAASVIGDQQLALTFADGQQLNVDLSEIIRRHPVLAPLANRGLFARIEVTNGGRSVMWNGDDMLELASDNLRARAIEQTGEASHETIWNWMHQHGLTLDAAAQALGLSRRMLAYYRSGEKPVPRTVALAMLGWEVEQAA
ncbi:MAG: DUF2442 domain-containing protein [Pseudomonadota bacterium]|nr:DUF2442 domain-containing protein [Pseudomonadota bacterium]